MNDDRIMRIQYPEVCSLTKREQFAMAAMQGLCSCPIPGTHNQAANVSKEAVRQADALLAALAKGEL